MKLEDFLRTVPAFAELDADDVSALSQTLSVIDCPAGHVFFREGDDGDAVYLIVDGEVDIVARPAAGGGFNVKKRLGRGEAFGLVALVDRQPRSATCSAAGRAKVALLPGAVATTLFSTHAPISYAFQRLVAEQLAADAIGLYAKIQQAVLGGGQTGH